MTIKTPKNQAHKTASAPAVRAVTTSYETTTASSVADADTGPQTIPKKKPAKKRR